MRQIVICLIIVQKFTNLKKKVLKLLQPHYVQEIFQKIGNGYVYDFSVDYDATDVDDIKDIHKYLMKKNNMV